MKRALMLAGLAVFLTASGGVTQENKRERGKPLNASKPNASWSKVVSAQTLEDEVKRISIALNKEISTPTKFKSGGYKAARLHFNELAALFAAISQYDKQVRWQMQATAISRTFSRSARNCKVGSEQAFNEAKKRQTELAELLRGGEFPVQKDLLEPIDSWEEIYDLSPLMKRMEQAFSKSLQKHTADAMTLRKNKDEIVHQAEIVALVGKLIIQEGGENADDQDFQQHAKKLSVAAGELADAAKLNGLDAAKAAVAQIGMSCTRCHEEWR